MSMFSVYVVRQVKKHGAKKLIFKILDMVVKATPSKEDDKLVAKIKEAMKEF